MAKFYPKLRMPAIYHEHDAEWIHSQLEIIPERYRSSAILGYNTVYSEAKNNEPVEHKRDNKARHEANIRLRIFVSKVKPEKPKPESINYQSEFSGY